MMEMLKLARADAHNLMDRLASLSENVVIDDAYAGVAKHGFARCGDGTCANTNSSDSCRKGCNGWD